MGDIPTWFYFTDDEGVIYVTHNQKAVWELDENARWIEARASFEQLSRFRSDLRDLSADEAKRIPKPPSQSRPL